MNYKLMLRMLGRTLQAMKDCWDDVEAACAAV